MTWPRLIRMEFHACMDRSIPAGPDPESTRVRVLILKLRLVQIPISIRRSSFRNLSKQRRYKMMEVSMQFLKILWCDVSGIRRCRVVPLMPNSDGIRGWLQSLQIGDNNFFISADTKMTMIALFLPCFGDVAVITNGFAEELRVSVAGTPVPLPHSNDYLCVSSLCDITRVPWSETYESLHRCPRAFLAATVDRLEACFGLRLQIGFETEFILLKKVTDRDGNEKYVPLETSVYSQSSGFDHASTVLREICVALEHAGQRVLQVHGESAHGQFEIVTDYGDVLSQADGFLIRKEIIQYVAHQHGLYATFLPKYFKDQAGSASHVHFSFVRDNPRRLLEADEKCEYQSDLPLPKDLQMFMAGIIENMGGLLIFTASSPNSTRRIQPGCWAGAYACWGFFNKEAPLRVLSAENSHVEFKGFDGSANPYMGLNGLINAGMDGIVRKLELQPAVQVNPALLPPGRCKRLPKSFEETVIDFQKSMEGSKLECGMMHEWYKSYVGQDKNILDNFFEDFLAVKRAELERFKNTSFEEEVAILFDKY